MPSLTRRAALAGAASPAAARAGARSSPRRVVSLNPCLDAILVEVADRTQIAALSHYAREPQGSTIVAIARTLPETFESAEEILMLRPDLVLASRHTALATREALARFGVKAELFAVPDTVQASLDQIVRIAALVGHPDRGAALIGRIRAALAAAAPPPGSSPITARVFQPQGFAAGGATLIDEMLRRTGFVNVAARYGIRQWGTVSLERLIADPPTVLLAGQASPGAPTWAERVLSHPALKALAGRMRRAVFPERLLYCGGPALIRTAAVLAAARRGVAS
jgi:iron complex transport system substrate-binding protein